MEVVASGIKHSPIVSALCFVSGAVECVKRFDGGDE